MQKKLDLYRTTQWMFDDENTGLYREPFVRGSSEILDVIAENCGLTTTMSISFSDKPDPDWDYRLEILQEQNRSSVLCGGFGHDRLVLSCLPSLF